MMEARGTRLLPRLMTTLNTLENDAEIVQTVRRIRALSGAEAAFGVVGADDVSLAHPDQKVALRLRGLGLLLRLRENSDAEVDAAVRRVETSLVHGGAVGRMDLLLVLGHVRDLLGAVDDDDGPARGAGGYYERSATRVESQLWDSMNLLWNRNRR